MTRILVAGGGEGARQRLSSLLRIGDRIVIEATLDNAESEIRRETPDVLLALLPDSGGPSLLRTLVAADPVGGMYVIAVTSDGHHPRLVASAVAAGSHDVLCAPFTDHELRMRVDAQRRLARWMSSRNSRDPASPTASSPLTDLRAWHYLGDLVADDFEATFGRAVNIEERWPTFTATSRLAAISMTLPTEQLELCISVVADPSVRCWLGETLLGAPDTTADMLDDILRELANVAGGALKRAVSVEGPILTTGIPANGRSMPTSGSGSRCWTVDLDDGVALAVIAEVYRRTSRRVSARRLVEGMVVASDVRNQAGVLLLPSGTRLTLTTAQRLSHILDTELVEVAS